MERGKTDFERRERNTEEKENNTGINKEGHQIPGHDITGS